MEMNTRGMKMAEGIFKTRFAALIQTRGLTQRELADKTRLTEGAISHYLKGDREPKGAILLAIANALETTTDFLNGKSDVMTPSEVASELEQALKLIARNAAHMNAEDRDKFLKILYGGKQRQ